MQQQQDKEFDARLREKMQGFTVSPPPPVWERIDKEINGPVRRKKPGYGWLKIAACVCVLAAAGVWLYQYRSPFEKETALALGEQDSIASLPEPSVRILNKSRSRTEAGPTEAGQTEAGQKGIGETEVGRDSAGQTEVRQQGAKQIETGRSEAGQSEAAQTDAGRGKPAGTEVGKPRPEVEKTVRKGGSPGDLRQEKTDKSVDPDRTGDPVIAGIDPLWNPEQPTLALIDPSATENSRIFVSGSEAATSGSQHTVAKEFTADASSPANEQEEKKNPIVPEKIRELSGFGEALNLAAATIDRSRDKFIRVKKDEESGKWSGLRLDLGLVTISYNKPAEENAQ